MKGLVVNAVPAVTMSSRELAALTGKEHRNVLRDIRAMLVELYGEGGVLSFEHTYRNEQNGQLYPEFILPRREVEILLTGYSIALRARVIDRLRELEAQQQPRIPQTYAEALRLAADQAEQIARQQALIEQQKPAVQFVESYVHAEGSMGFRQVAKLLKANERQFKDMLLNKGVMYYLGGVLTPKTAHIVAGRFEVKTGTSKHNDHAYTQARFTPKGVQWVAGLWASHQMVQGDAVQERAV